MKKIRITLTHTVDIAFSVIHPTCGQTDHKHDAIQQIKLLGTLATNTSYLLRGGSNV